MRFCPCIVTLDLRVEGYVDEPFCRLPGLPHLRHLTLAWHARFAREAPQVSWGTKASLRAVRFPHLESLRLVMVSRWHRSLVGLLEYQSDTLKQLSFVNLFLGNLSGEDVEESGKALVNISFPKLERFTTFNSICPPRHLARFLKKHDTTLIEINYTHFDAFDSQYISLPAVQKGIRGDWDSEDLAVDNLNQDGIFPFGPSVEERIFALGSLHFFERHGSVVPIMNDLIGGPSRMWSNFHFRSSTNTWAMLEIVLRPWNHFVLCWSLS